MKITVIGSGTVVPDAERVCAGYYVETGRHRLLLDCGPGTVHHMARYDAPWAGLTHIALSHFHTDHVGGLPILFFALKHGLSEPRREPLTVYGPEGTEAFFQRMAEAFGDHLRDPGFPLHIQELGTGAAVKLGEDVRLRAHATPHTDASVGYRMEAPEGVLGYTGDTGPSPELGRFLRGVDVLIAECSLPDEEAIPTHLSPGSVAALAREAAPGTLVLTHVYPQLAGQDVPARVRAAGWSGPVRMARDGMRLQLP